MGGRVVVGMGWGGVMSVLARWGALFGKYLLVDGEKTPLQCVIFHQCKHLILSTQVKWDAEVPRMRQALLTTAVFRDLCRVQDPGAKYVEALGAKFSAVWKQVGSADKFFRRFLYDGDSVCRQVFLNAIDRPDYDNQPGKLSFSAFAPNSEFASIEEKLEKAWHKIEEEREQRRIEEANARAEAEAGKEALENARDGQKPDDAPTIAGFSSCSEWGVGVGLIRPTPFGFVCE